jgi:hypothetical protein
MEAIAFDRPPLSGWTPTGGGSDLFGYVSMEEEKYLN